MSNLTENRTRLEEIAKEYGIKLMSEEECKEVMQEEETTITDLVTD